MKSNTIFIFIVFSIIFLNSCKQTENTKTEPTVHKEAEDPAFVDDYKYFRLMFYNAENLFDTFDDTLKRDESFLPDREHYWNMRKYNKKILNICKVITAVGGWNPPAIVGICEIENRYVLEGITKHTPLNKHNYQIIHYESPDRRGIDVGMLYLKNKFTPIESRPITIHFPMKPNGRTRDILYVKGKTFKDDTLHIFINHWPSKYGGAMATVPLRNYVASVVKSMCDSISKANPRANIIVTGDLNDGVEAECVKDVLDARTEYDHYRSTKLYNTSYYLEKKKGLGTHKFHGEWGILDHMILSGALLDKKNTIYTTLDNSHVFKADFLMEKDEGNFGFKPFRTYIGMKFNDGYSDHLPVFIDFYRQDIEK